MVIVTPSCFTREEGKVVTVACAAPFLISGVLFHSYPCPQGNEGRTDCGLRASPLVRGISAWEVEECDPCHSILLTDRCKEGRNMISPPRQGVSMASTLLLLGGGQRKSRRDRGLGKRDGLVVTDIYHFLFL